MNVQSVDLGDELRKGVEFCLDLAPIVLCRPIASECLSRRELHALRGIWDRLPLRPLCCVDPSAQFGKFRLWNIYIRKRTNCSLVRCLRAVSLCSTGLVHGVLLLRSFVFLVQRPDIFEQAGKKHSTTPITFQTHDIFCPLPATGTRAP